MAICAQCGLMTHDGAEICWHHVVGDGDEWSTINRTMCDFVHRRIVPRTSSQRRAGLDVLTKCRP